MNFKQNIKQSFKHIKRDFDVLKVSFVNWLNYLRYKQLMNQKRIEALEARVAELEEKNKIIVTTY